MAQTIFATPADYWKSTGMLVEDYPLPGSAEFARISALLVTASADVSRMTRLARLPYLSDGTPKGAKVVDAFRDATVAQVIKFEEDGDSTGFSDGFDSVSLIGVQFSRRRTPGGQPVESSRYSRNAVTALVNAGIFTTAVRHP